MDKRKSAKRRKAKSVKISKKVRRVRAIKYPRMGVK